jgi:molybdate transport system substrate-binding protein
VVKRVQDGEAVDLVIIPGQGVERLVKAGKAAADSVVPKAPSGMGVAVRKDAAKPDISSPDALKGPLLAARNSLSASEESVTVRRPAHGCRGGGCMVYSRHLSTVRSVPEGGRV